MWALWLILFLIVIALLGVGGYFIYEHFKCKPNCKGGKICGDNGCKGSCGSCPSGKSCSSDRKSCISPSGGGGGVTTNWSSSDKTKATGKIKSTLQSTPSASNNEITADILSCVLKGVIGKYKTLNQFINDPNLKQNLIAIYTSCMSPTCNPACLSNEICFSDIQTCVGNTWTEPFSTKLADVLAKALSITDQTVLTCLMKKIKKKYSNPQDFMQDKNSETITKDMLNLCTTSPDHHHNKPHPRPPQPTPGTDKPRPGGETFADQCIQEYKRTSTTGKQCMPEDIMTCVQKSGHCRNLNNSNKMQQCFEDAINWAQNHCTTRPGHHPNKHHPHPPQPTKYSYCGKENGKCVCKQSDTKPPGVDVFSDDICEGIGVGGKCDSMYCEKNEALYAVY
jgi:hypothetical protein